MIPVYCINVGRKFYPHFLLFEATPRSLRESPFRARRHVVTSVQAWTERRIEKVNQQEEERLSKCKRLRRMDATKVEPLEDED